MAVQRSKKITIRVSEAEKSMYDELAKLKGKKLSELVRYLLDKECDSP